METETTTRTAQEWAAAEFGKSAARKVAEKKAMKNLLVSSSG